MDRNNSLERRYSFNAAQSIPVAESTHLSGNSFSWGSSSISPKQRSNSSICLNNTPSNSSKTILTSPKYKHVTKIDARIVADVQSKGLASRIVKYHASGTRLNRSMSAHNLYSKPGQFPVVTLTKTDLPYRATKQNLSMTRIAPPEKSMFYGNSLSSLLRSSSVVGLQKSNEDISRENRPILHPPPTENDMAPTRSVLDVLKEISRKRINSDDLDATEVSKKYCNRAGNDLVDTGINSSYPNLPTHLISSGKSFKRQRDVTAPYQSIQVQESRTSPEQANKRLCNYNNDITSSLSSSKKSKPHEQKRSSFYLNQTLPTNLESYETQKAKVQRYHELSNIQDDMRFDNMANNLRKVDTIKPITPIPATPSTQDHSGNGVAPQRAISEPLYRLDERNSTFNGVHPANKPRLTLFNKNYDVDTDTSNADSVAENEDNVSECAGIQFVKPKKLTSKTGFKNPVIERTQKSKLALMLSGLRGELYQTNDFDELDSTKVQEKSTVGKSNCNTQITSTTSASNSLSTSTTTLTTVTSSITLNNIGMQNATTTKGLTTTTTTTANAPTNVSTLKTTSSPLVGLKLTPKKSIDNGLILNCVNKSNADSSESPSKPNIPVLGRFSFGTSQNLTNTLAPVTTSSSPNVVATFTALDVSKAVPFLSPPQLLSTTAITNTTNTAPLINFGTTPAKENSVTAGSHSVASKGLSIDTSTMSFGTTPQIASASANSVQTHVGGTGALNSVTKPNAAFSFEMSSSTTTTTSTAAASASATFDTSSVAAPTTNTVTSNTPSFGFNSAATTASAASVFEAVAVTTANSLTSTSFSFGQPSSQPVTTTYSSSEKPSEGFSFSSNTLRQASTFAPATKTQTPSLSTTTPFSFGSATTISNSGQSSSVDNNTSSVFNTNSNKDNSLVFNTAAPSVFVGNCSNSKSENNSTNLFGESTNKPIVTTSSPGGFAFGSANTAKPSNSSTFSFGSSVNTTNANIASNNGASIGFAFGTSASKSSDIAVNEPFSFGIASSPTPQSLGVPVTTANRLNSTSFSFGQPSGQPVTTTYSSSEKPSEGFSFSSNTLRQASTFAPNNSTATKTQTTSLSTTTPFSFGSATTISNSGQSSSVNNNTSSVFNTNSNKDNSLVFNTAAPSVFVGNCSNSKSENNSTKLFGESTNKSIVTTSSPGGFSFGSANTAKPSNSSTFSFGSSVNTTNANIASNNGASIGFAFGTPASKSSDIAVNEPFSFGIASSPTPQSLGVPNNNSSTSNLFGLTTAPKNAPPAFNFGSSTNAQPCAPSPNNNIFAPPPSNIAAIPGDRPIRRATRRLQK